MKLQVKTRRELETVAMHLTRAVAYLQRPDIMGVATATAYPNGADYTIRNPACVTTLQPAEHISAVNHRYGSDITGLYEGLRQLRRMLDAESEAK